MGQMKPELGKVPKNVAVAGFLLYVCFIEHKYFFFWWMGRVTPEKIFWISNNTI